MSPALIPVVAGPLCLPRQTEVFNGREDRPDFTEMTTAFAIHLRVMEDGHAMIGEEMRQYFVDDED